MLHLHLWYDFYNTVIKNKIQTTYIFSDSPPPPPPPKKKPRCAWLLLWSLQFLRFLSFLHISLLLGCPPPHSSATSHFLFTVLHRWVQFLRLFSFFSSPTSWKHKRQQPHWFLTSLRTNLHLHHHRNYSLSTGCLAFFMDGLTFEDGNDRLSWNVLKQLPAYAAWHPRIVKGA